MVVEKINCKVRIGIIVRDENDLVTAAIRQNKSIFPHPLLVEAIGVFEVIKFGRHLGLLKILLEGDSFHIVQAIKREEESWSAIGLLVSDMKDQLQSIDN